LKFLTYNRQNVTAILNKEAKNIDKDQLALAKLMQECMLEEKF
jgi:hypothetical protein